MHRRTVAWWTAGAGLAAAVLVGTCRERPVEVTVEPARRDTLVGTVAEEGRTAVRDRFVVAAPVAGRVERIALEPGDSVRRDAVVACLYPQPLDARSRAEAIARRAAAADELEAARAAEAEARDALAQATRDRERMDRLEREHAIAAQAGERERLVQRLRERQLEASRARVNAAAHQLEEARAALVAAGPSARGACFDVHAPATGRVLRVLEESERVVQAGTPILELGDPGRLDVVADLLSEDAVKVRVGDTMLVEGWGGPGSLVARVRLVEPAGFTKVSALGVEEQRVRVHAEIAAPPAGLGDGYRVDVRVVLWRGTDVLQAPSTALFRRGGDWHLFVVEDGRIRERAVAIGRQGEGRTEITGGLEAGALVVRQPSDRLADGTRARPARRD
jgi:HlyD family secretion protein